MKKQLLALSMVATSGLLAQPDAPMQKPAHNQSNSCSTCCCTPCCCTNPRPCIDCECYVPAFHNLQCDWGFFLDVEFLYWYAREDNLPYAARTLTEFETGSTTSIRVNPTSVKRLDAKWDPGVRAGIGWNMDCDGWDIYLNWTYYKNTSSESATLPPFESTTFPDTPGDQSFLDPYITNTLIRSPYYSRTSSKWRNRFNQIDLEIGKKYWLSRCFALRPFAGLRGAWTRTRFEANFASGPAGEFNNVDIATSTFKNRIWGVGFEAGLEPTWYFSNCFALYGEFGLSAIWGEFCRRKTDFTSFENDNFPLEESSLSVTDSFYKMSGILDVGLGIRWESTWCCDRYRTALDLGWEHHYWIGHGEYYKEYGFFEVDDSTGNADLITRFGMEKTDLGYGGLVVRVRWDF